ncbi:aarF domain-containing protein kinase 1-like [Belonocnema kinseyi]|uniref:aarF domain-containing protein kinase 1-like n=1 Tax=Belonocnema kinseyi TaxID=2817044 RepID=UPI00143D198F|nr:aarF domain-containing protein kinase 1-like [Belonocnema kinseyi]
MLISRRLLKTIAVGTVGLGTLASLRANEYDVGAIGIVRLGRAAVTVFQIGNHYQKHLYKANVPRGSPEYEALKSEAHKFGAQQLLELCCANKGVYIKVKIFNIKAPLRGAKFF